MHLWTGKSQYILELIRGSSRIWTPDRIGFVLAEVCALQVLLPLIDFLNCMGNYEVTLSLCFTSTYVYAGYGYHVFNNDFFDIKIRQIYYEYNVPLYFLTQLNIETCKGPGHSLKEDSPGHFSEFNPKKSPPQKNPQTLALHPENHPGHPPTFSRDKLPISPGKSTKCQLSARARGLVVLRVHSHHQLHQKVGADVADAHSTIHNRSIDPVICSHKSRRQQIRRRLTSGVNNTIIEIQHQNVSRFSRRYVPPTITEAVAPLHGGPANTSVTGPSRRE